jgi:hypothetical protein
MKEETDASSEAGPKTTTIIYIIVVVILSLMFLTSIIICICIIQRLRKKNNQEVKSNNLHNTDGSKPARTEPVITAEQWKSFFLPLTFTTELGSLDRCVVCLDLFIHNETPITQILICEHYFHLECIKLWLGKEEKCPVCKTRLGMWD